MGKRKIRSDFDPVLRAIRTGGSVLIYTTKASIYDKTVFNKFKLYIDECRSLTDPQALQLIDQFKNALEQMIKMKDTMHPVCLSICARA